MSDCAAAIRDTDKMKELLSSLDSYKNYGAVNIAELFYLYLLKDTITVQKAVLTAMVDFSDTVNSSRGSAIYTDSFGAKIDNFNEIMYKPFVDKVKFDEIQEISNSNGIMTATWRKVRPIPEEDDVFENIWRSYRENKNIY